MFDLMEIILRDFFLWCFWFNDSSYEFEKLTRVDIFLTFFFGLIVQHGFFFKKKHIDFAVLFNLFSIVLS
jgi:hypothetical protein